MCVHKQQGCTSLCNPIVNKSMYINVSPEHFVTTEMATMWSYVPKTCASSGTVYSFLWNVAMFSLRCPLKRTKFNCKVTNLFGHHSLRSKVSIKIYDWLRAFYWAKCLYNVNCLCVSMYLAFKGHKKVSLKTKSSIQKV